MNCPNCKQELKYHDWFGTNMGFTRIAKKIGDIYKCENEECENYEQFFYTRREELFEGYPC
jgi:hypothetical protein